MRELMEVVRVLKTSRKSARGSGSVLEDVRLCRSQNDKTVLVGVVCGPVQAVEVLIEAVRVLVEAESANNGFEIVVEAVKMAITAETV